MIEILPNWHPAFVHFTVALLSISVLAFIVSVLSKTYNVQYQARLLGRWCLWLGVIFSIFTAAAGVYAYYTVNHDTPSHYVMTIHRNLAIGTLVVFLVMSIWTLINYRTERDEGKTFILSGLIGAVLLAVTAWHGGELVYRYGIGVVSLPDSSGKGHEHGGHDHGSHKHTDTPGSAPHDHEAMGEHTTMLERTELANN